VQQGGKYHMTVWRIKFCTGIGRSIYQSINQSINQSKQQSYFKVKIMWTEEQ